MPWSFWTPSVLARRSAVFAGLPSLDSLSPNEWCFIRKEHKCGKIFGASKSAFIACPTDDELQPILELMSEKLSKVGIEPIIAVKERAYGQDIFCTKICGKIIESRFCIVILDDTLRESTNIPNPNVYYEYGLMTALRKQIIPLQKDNLKLAFNIQSHDTIKYNTRNIASELDRAIKDAVRVTEAKEKDDRKAALPQKSLLRKFEIAGWEEQGDRWPLHDAIADTNFKGFEHHDKHLCLLLAKIDEKPEFQECAEDLGVVIYRVERKVENLKLKLSVHKKKKKSLKTRIEQEQEELASKHRPPSSITLSGFRREESRIESEIGDIEDNLSLLATVFIGFIIHRGLEVDDFIPSVDELIRQYDRYHVSYSSEKSISFGDISVDL